MTGLAPPSARGADGLIHAALLYRDPQQLVAAVTDYVREAAHAGEPVLAVLPTAQLALLRSALSAPGASVETEDMTQVGRNPGRLIPLLARWLDEQGTPARVITESLWPGRSYAEMSECLRHEALVNLALAEASASVLCLYDAEHLDGEAIAGAEMTHPQLIDEAGPRASVVYEDPVWLAEGHRWPQAEPTPPLSEFAFDGDLYALRQALAGDPLLHDLDPDRRQDLVFAVNEAATNAVVHGQGGCRARVWREDDRIVSEIRTPTAIEDPLAGRRHPEPTATEGRGLWLINQMCDLVELRNGPDGASLRMHVAGA